MKTNTPDYKNAISQLQAAKLQIIACNHAFLYNTKVYYKLLPEDKTELNTSVDFFKAEKLRYADTVKKHKELENREPESLKNGVVLHIEFTGGAYHLPANTYFIDEILKGLAGRNVVKFEKYNEMPINIEFKKIGIINKSELSIIKKVSKFAENDLILGRTMLNCICINDLYIYASDSHRLIKRPINNPMNVLINKQGQKFISTCKNDITIEESKNELILTSDGKSILIDKCFEPYPIDNANRFLNTKNPFNFSVDRISLINAVSRMAIYANQASNLIKLEVTENRLLISACDTDFSIDSKEVLNINNANFTGSIGYKSDFLIDILKTLDSGDVVFNIKNASEMSLINDIVLMPMMLNDASEIKANEPQIQPEKPQQTARKEMPKPKAPKPQPAKITKPSEVQPDKQLSEILATLQAGEFLFQKEVTYLQRHGTPSAGYRYNRFAKLERVRA